jgi:leucyl-tRNA synthetase
LDFEGIEKKWQSRWKEAGIFVPRTEKKRKKFFFTTPYPYISGSLHIGHGRAVTESDIYVRYMRMKGYNVLYPLAFHITGTPVLGISSAIEKGDRKKIGIYRNYVKNYLSRKKDIDDTLKSFRDPWNIVNFFIPKMMDEYSSLGLSIDWSRRFTTGDPDYQKFITWQFTKYREKRFLIKGSYPVLFCPSCKNAVGEDDIQDADTNPVVKQEFTLLKFPVKDLVLVAATLRPETVFGQTNLWVNPRTEYLKVRVGREKWVISREGFRKLSYQKKGLKIIGRIRGTELLGKHALAPGIDREVPILPSRFADPNVGSGIVTSVPGDAPYDWMALRNLQKDRKTADRYGLNYDEITKIRAVPIIDTPGWGDLPALEISRKMGLENQSDPRLEEATHTIYREGFHKGVMKGNCGRYAGMKVYEAKERVKDDLIKKGRADLIYETSREAFCRDGTRIVVAVLEDQWFLDFNAGNWKEQARKCLAGMTLIPDSIRSLFLETFEWLDKRPAARRRGLGTPLPFDREWIIESLSDSTIYMSFYTIKNLINKYGIKPEQMVSEFFDYVYLGEGHLDQVSRKTGIDAKALKEMRESFDYWYPNDHRHTYMAHLSNHLSFFIFAHAGIFPQRFWPRKISIHGFVISGGVKMSKSKGNVISLLDVRRNYGADTFRAYISTATNLEGTFNWKSEEALNMKKRLSGIYSTICEMIERGKPGELGSAGKAVVSRFESHVGSAGKALESMRLRQYGNTVIYEIPNALRKAQRRVPEKELFAIYDLVTDRWIRMLSPVVPHLSEELWEKAGRKGFVSAESWPVPDSKLIDHRLEMMEDLADATIDDIREIIRLVGKEPKGIRIYTAPGWKHTVYKTIMKQFRGREPRDIVPNLMKIPEVRKQGKHAIRFAERLSRIPNLTEMLTDQEEFGALSDLKGFLEKEFSCRVEVIEGYRSSSEKALRAEPGKPGIEIVA